MYNRYIPQHDGSYQRRRVAEPHTPPYIPTQEPIPVPPESCTVPEPDCSNCPNRPIHHRDHGKNQGAFSFFKDLIPPGLDSEDLLILVLLLLMSGDCREDRNLPLLTLALYLFL